MVVSGFGLHIHIISEYIAGMEVEDNGELRCFKYPRNSKDEITIRMSTSLISYEQAKISMERELPAGKSFEDIMLEAKMTWNR